MKPISCRVAMLAASGLVLLAGTGAHPAYARDFVQDQAKMFSDATVTQLNARIGSFNAQTGKEIVVVTTPSLGGATLQSAADAAYTQQNVNGVLIFIARDDRRDIIVPDGAAKRSGWFAPETLRSIRTTMESQFKSENYDAGITGAVGAVLDVYRQNLGSLSRPAGGVAATAQRGVSSLGGLHIPMFWWIIIAIVGFLILRSILRAVSGPRYYGGAPGAPPPGTPSGPGYGAGYGPGYGYGGYGGGGSFWSGLLGGLGGAWLGNELFRGGGAAQATQVAPDAGGGWGGTDSGSGWQSDPGQADTSGASAGDWSGGGFGDGGGGDFGGGGGDSGGGW